MEAFLFILVGFAIGVAVTSYVTEYGITVTFKKKKRKAVYGDYAGPH